MIKNIKRFFKDESGQITTTEVVILVAVIALVAGLFGKGLEGVFTGKEGAVDQLKGFVDGKFDEVMKPKTGQ
jgi:Flp pilus assembly pilin Flp